MSANLRQTTLFAITALCGLALTTGCLTDFDARSGRDGGDATALDGGTVDAGDSTPVDAALADASQPDASPNCGNGEVDPPEQCDDGNASNNDDCTNLCQNPDCGDGHIWTGHESCDDGNNVNTDNCLNNCAPASCGDSYTWAGVEGCDDGNNTSYNDACLPGCVAASCGDGYLWQGQEECDDGNTVSGDGCSPSCDEEEGWTCSGQPSTCDGICSDGLVRGDEECDDLDTQSGDGCSYNCNTEPFWQCNGEPSVCDGICQDNVVRGTEQCDDGNAIAGDGCSPTCTDEDLPVLRWRESSSTWSTLELTYAGNSHAPNATEYPIVGAGTVDLGDLALVFTRTTWHELDLDTHVFTDSGILATTFSTGGSPVIDWTQLRAAQGQAGGNPMHLYFYVGNNSYVFTYNYLTNAAAYSSGPHYLPTHWSSSCCGGAIPNPLLFSAAYLDLENMRGWTDPSVICGTGSPPEPHGLFILSTGHVHLQDYGCGDTFYDDRSYGVYPAFTSSSAPPYSEITAAFYDEGRDRLYVITHP